MASAERKRSKKYASVKSSGYGKLNQIQMPQNAIETSQFFQPSKSVVQNPFAASTSDQDGHLDCETSSRGSTQHKYENDGTSCSEAGDLSQSTSSRSPGVCKHTRDRANTVAESKICSQEVLLAPDVLQMAQMMSEITENIDLCHPLDVNMETVKEQGKAPLAMEVLSNKQQSHSCLKQRRFRLGWVINAFAISSILLGLVLWLLEADGEYLPPC